MVEYSSKMKAFPCDHAICEDCVSRLTEGLTRPCTWCEHYHSPGMIKCPMCNDVVYSVNQLRDDHRNDKFLDVIEAVSSRGNGKTRQLIQNPNVCGLDVRTYVYIALAADIFIAIFVQIIVNFFFIHVFLLYFRIMPALLPVTERQRRQLCPPAYVTYWKTSN